MVYVPTALIGLGLVLLFFASQWTMEYAISMSESLALGRFAIGFTFISLSTSFPELFVALSSSFHGQGGLGIGNVLGSVFANLSIVLGVAVLIGGTLYLDGDDLGQLIEILFISALITLFMLQAGELFLLQGVVLILLGIVFLHHISHEKIPMKEEPDFIEFLRSTIFFLASMGLLIISSEMIVRGAIDMIDILGVTPEFLGLTVITVGTSLPELAVGVQSIREAEYAMALGDVIGSSIINITVVMGIIAAVAPTPVNLLPVTGVIPFILVSILFLWYLLSRGKDITKRTAIVLISLFVLFIIEQIGIVTLLS